MVRCFVGIFLPEDTKDKVEEAQKMVVRAGAECKLVERKNLHISLSFLGDVYDLRVTADKIRSSVAGMKRFTVSVKDVRLIPSENFIRVIALGASDSRDSLESLRKSIKMDVGGDSHEAHVTLCRVKKISDKGQFLEKIRSSLKYDCGEFEVKGVQLIKSELSGEGPTYTIVEDFPLE